MATYSINELSQQMRHCYQVLNQMKLVAVKSELTPGDITWFRQSKLEISPMLAKLKELSPSLLDKIRKRQSKRRRQKMVRLRTKRKKLKASEKEKEMDALMSEVRREEEKKEKISQQSRIVQEKIAIVERQLSLLSSLANLAKVRGCSIEPAASGLQTELTLLRERFTEERETRKYLFNVAASPETLCPNLLMKRRSEWDRYVSTEAAASSIPVGWVMPRSRCQYCELVVDKL